MFSLTTRNYTEANMNDALDFIFSRRSVRVYEDKPIPEKALRDLLEAAMAAPSACCSDPWHFVVARERETLDALAGALPHGAMLADAGAAVAVCGDMNKADGGQFSYLLQDCCAATQNLLLAANALGLGSVWLGVHPGDDRIARIRSVLEIPSNVIPICVVSLGWPGEAPEARTRYKESRVHHESW